MREWDVLTRSFARASRALFTTRGFGIRRLMNRMILQLFLPISGFARRYPKPGIAFPESNGGIPVAQHGSHGNLVLKAQLLGHNFKFAKDDKHPETRDHVRVPRIAIAYGMRGGTGVIKIVGDATWLSAKQTDHNLV